MVSLWRSILVTEVCRNRLISEFHYQLQVCHITKINLPRGHSQKRYWLGLQAHGKCQRYTGLLCSCYKKRNSAFSKWYQVWFILISTIYLVWPHEASVLIHSIKPRNHTEGSNLTFLFMPSVIKGWSLEFNYSYKHFTNSAPPQCRLELPHSLNHETRTLITWLLLLSPMETPLPQHLSATTNTTNV